MVYEVIFILYLPCFYFSYPFLSSHLLGVKNIYTIYIFTCLSLDFNKYV